MASMLPSLHRCSAIAPWVGFAALLAPVPTPAASPSVDGRWVEIGTPTRFNALMGYDSVNDRALLFSRVGHRFGLDEFDQWALSLGSPHWEHVPEEGDPPDSDLAPVVLHDPSRERLLVVRYGGAHVYVHDLVSSAWSRIDVTGAPGYSGHFAYDPSNERVLMFGVVVRCASPRPCYRNDVWVLPLAGSRQWTKLEIGGARPLGRTESTLMYDPEGERLFLFGGYAGESSGGFLGDVWELSLSGTPQWKRLDPMPNTPPARFYAQTILVTAEQRFLLYGDPSTVWSLRVDSAGPPVWERLSVEEPPSSADFGSSWTFDVPRRRIVARTNAGATWVLPIDVPRRWIRLESAPPARSFGTMAYDSKRDRIVLFGGISGAIETLADAWTYPVGSAGRWEPIVTGSSPGPMGGPTAVWDPQGDRLVMIGRRDDRGPLETWFLEIGDTPAWTRFTPAGSPPSPRWGHTMVLDPLRNAVLVFGGVENGTIFGDVWELTLGAAPAWKRLAPAGPSPPPRGGAAAVYDTRRDRMLVFGGLAADADDVWALTLGATPQWSSLRVTGSPGFLNFAGAIYDSEADRIVVISNSSGAMLSPWALPLTGEPAWQRLQPLDVPPVTRAFAPVTLDTRRERLLLFGGQLSGEVGMFSDLWALDWERDGTTAIAVQLVGADAGSDQVRLSWHAPGMTAATVERRGEEVTWFALGAAERSGRDGWTFVDRAVAPGARFAYRLRYLDEGVEWTSSEAWVEIPRQAGFGIRAISPNPAHDVLDVRFALDTEDRAGVEIVDVNGRRVVAWDRSPGTGLHEARLTIPPSIRPGIYWVRVAQGARTDSRRISIVR